MKSILIAASLLVGASAFANQTSVQELQSKLGGKALVCKPSNKKTPWQKSYRGDDGYFAISVKNGQPEVTDNGGDGYGFASGEVKDVVVSSDELYFVAGDDGSQTLQLNLSNIGGDSSVPDNCVNAILISEPDVNYLYSTNLQCCLK